MKRAEGIWANLAGVRLASMVIAVFASGCGLLLDLDEPDPQPAGVDGGGIDGGRGDGGRGDGGAGRDCEDAIDGRPCGDPGTPRICVSGVCVRSRCGDGLIDPLAGETCEDENDVSGDGCEPGTCAPSCSANADCGDVDDPCVASMCTTARACVNELVPNAPCARPDGMEGVCSAGACVPPSCGNGLVEADEHCDDGNNLGGDGCGSDCRPECTSDLDCDDEIGCNGVERCELAVDGGQTLGRCRPSSDVIIAPACHACDLATGEFALIDNDRDGFAAESLGECGGDCDDEDPRIHPGAVDPMRAGDGVDADCDDRIDEDVLITCWRDADGDGFGDRTAPVEVSEGICPAGSVPAPADPNEEFRADCDDGDPDVFPGQAAWFAVSRCASASPPMASCFDYDCDGVAQPRWPRRSGCRTLLGCPGEGWVGTVPACGATGTWETCIQVLNICLAPTTTSRVQQCH